MKGSMKIKISNWYIRIGAVITKNNLANCNCSERKKVLVFPSWSYNRKFAINIWLKIQLASHNMYHLTYCLKKYFSDPYEAILAWAGVVALIWSLWQCSNDMVFRTKSDFPCSIGWCVAPFIVYFSSSRTSRDDYGGVYIFWAGLPDMDGGVLV
jgi:hypothetical protein